MNKDLILHGIRIGEYGVDPETVIDDIKRDCIDKGMNYVAFSVGGVSEQKYFLEWAEYLKKKDIYFTFTRPLGITEETAFKIKEIAGDYYIGNIAPEIGSAYGCIAAGYDKKGTLKNTEANMEKAKERLEEAVRRGIDEVKAFCRMLQARTLCSRCLKQCAETRK